MPKDLTDIMVHFVLSIVIVGVLTFLLSYIIGDWSIIAAYVANFAFWAIREGIQQKQRYAGAWYNPLNWSRQKKLEGLAAPAAGGAFGVLICMVVVNM